MTKSSIIWQRLSILTACFAVWVGTAQAQSDIVYTFSGAGSSADGTSYEFDINAASTAAGVKIGDLMLYLTYDSGSFGSSIVGAGGVTVTDGALISDGALYNVHVRDHAAGTLAIIVEFLTPDNPGDGSDLTSAPEKLLHVELNLSSLGTTPEVLLDTARMDGQQYRSDASQKFQQVLATPSSLLSPAAGAPGWSVNPADFSSSISLVGALSIEGAVSDDVDDLVAAFVGDEVRGVASSIEVGGTRLFFLTVYAGGNGETVTFKAWDASRNATLSVDETLQFSADEVHGSIQTPFGLTAAGSEQVIALSAGWNLISLTVIPDDTAPSDVFADLGGNLQYVTGFDGGATFFDPGGLPFLNTLSEIRHGRGYWVKVASDDELTVSGSSIPGEFSLDLATGWNLIGYWSSQEDEPADVFSDLTAGNVLDYVTGFDGGARFFDPNGLSFLNTLSTLRPGKGYWLKVNSPVAAFRYEEDVPGRVQSLDEEVIADAQTRDEKWFQEAAHHSKEDQPDTGSTQETPPFFSSPRFMFVGGSIGSLSAGQPVTVVTRSGLVVGRGFVDEKGRLPATAVYGDDPSTPEPDGAADGEELFLRIGDRTEALESRFQADMQLSVLDVSFERESAEIPVAYTMEPGYPNPFADRMTVRVGLPEEAPLKLFIVDVLGRRVQRVVDDVRKAGWHEISVSAAGMASGAYFLVFEAGGAREVRPIHVVK